MDEVPNAPDFGLSVARALKPAEYSSTLSIQPCGRRMSAVIPNGTSKEYSTVLQCIKRDVKVYTLGGLLELFPKSLR